MIRINLTSIIDKLTGFLLLCYIIAAAAFENYAPTSALSTYTLYMFALFAFVYMFCKRKIKFTYYTIAIFLYGIIIAISLFFAPDFKYGIQTLYWYYTCAVLTFLIGNYIDSFKKIYFLIKAYIISGIVLAIFLYSIYGMEIFSMAAKSNHGIRIGGELGNENVIGMTLSISCVFAAFLLFYHSSAKKEKMMYVLSVVICFPLILLTGSKKALFLVFFGIMLLIIYKPGDKGNIVKKLRYFLIGMIFLLLCTFIITRIKAFWFITERINEFIGIMLGKGSNDSDAQRFYMIRTGLNEFSLSPIFGNGVAYSRYIFGTYSHNNYIEILMNTGIVGFITYYSIYIISILKLYFSKSYDLKLRTLVLFIVISFLILEVGMVSYYNRYFQILIAASGIILSTKSGDKNEYD